MRSRIFPVLAAVFTCTVWVTLMIPGYCQAQAPEGISPASNSLTSQTLEDNALEQVRSNNRTTVEGSFQDATGIVNVNQAAGNLNNQGIAVLLPISEQTSPPNFAGLMTSKDNSLVIEDVYYGVAISNQAFRGGAGLAAVNQVSGNLNNQLTAVSVSVGTPSGSTATTVVGVAVDQGNKTAMVTVSNARLSQIVASQNNTVEKKGSVTGEAHLEDGAFQDFSGVGVVTQVAGNLNQVMHRVGVHVTTTP